MAQSHREFVKIVLHDLSLAIQYCDNVVVMVEGRVLTQGNAREIMQPELLTEIFGVPFVKFERDGRTYLNF